MISNNSTNASHTSKLRQKQAIGLGVVLVFLMLVYYPTFLTIINGSSDDFMADVGEAQVVLNTWGTLHATGYPLFVMLGNLFVSGSKILGVPAATAPVLYALVWGIAALALFYVLIVHLTGRITLAMAATALFGLTRYVWIHNVIAEVYSFALFIFILLLLIALWQREIPHRLEWLALIGGIGIGHHRGLILAIPPVVYAVLPQLIDEVKRRPRILVILFLLGWVGLVPYIYLPLRAWAGATWVYGEPGTLSGFWDQFMAREAPTILALPGSFAALAEKFNTVNSLFIDEVSPFGILLGIVGLVIALYEPNRRRLAITFMICASCTYVFFVVFFTDILAPVVTPITLSFVIGWVFLFDALSNLAKTRRYVVVGMIALTILFGAWLVSQNSNYINDLTHDPEGLRTIALVQNAPPGSTVMLPWGMRFYAVGFAQDVLGQLKQIKRIDDKVDLATFQGTLVTPDYVFYDYPIQWWAKKLDKKVYLRAIAPHLVQVDTAPQKLPSGSSVPSATFDATVPVVVIDQSVDCQPDSINVRVDWFALQKPSRDLSVFVHLLDSKGNLIAQSDQSAPVYGWRPLTTWEPGEVVQDIYSIPRIADATTIQYGLYEQLSSGEFKNYAVTTTPAHCNPVSK